MKIKNNKIAHRGVFNNKNIPENSLKAFEKAISMDFSIELDVQLTKDNVLIVFHDDNLKRLTGLNKKVTDCTYLEIKNLTLLETKEKIPTLKEVLNLVQNKVLLDIEIKGKKKIKTLCNLLIKELNSYENFILKSFNPRIVHYLKKHYSNLEVGYIIDKKRVTLFANKLIFLYTKPDFLAIHKSLLETKKFQKLKKKYPLLVWTIKKKDQISREEYVLICNDLI